MKKLIQFEQFIANDDIPVTENKTNELRAVKVTFENGDHLTTSMAAHLTDEDIKDYYKVGRSFNVGIGPNDNMQRVAKVDILK